MPGAAVSAACGTPESTARYDFSVARVRNCHWMCRAASHVLPGSRANSELRSKPWKATEAVTCVFSGKVAVEGELQNGAEMVCRVPGGNMDSIVSIRVLVDGEDASLGSELTFQDEPPVVVTGVIPSAGAVDGSTMVQVLGSGFKAGPGLGCVFGRSPAFVAFAFSGRGLVHGGCLCISHQITIL